MIIDKTSKYTTTTTDRLQGRMQDFLGWFLFGMGLLNKICGLRNMHRPIINVYAIRKITNQIQDTFFFRIGRREVRALHLPHSTGKPTPPDNPNWPIGLFKILR